jgi:hypothetical protein
VVVVIVVVIVVVVIIVDACCHLLWTLCLSTVVKNPEGDEGSESPIEYLLYSLKYCRGARRTVYYGYVRSIGRSCDGNGSSVHRPSSSVKKPLTETGRAIRRPLYGRRRCTALNKMNI